MYFSILPSIKYDKKPISYPFSENDFILAKNFFRRYELNEDVFSSITLFKKYTIPEGKKLYQVAMDLYGNMFYDWIIVLTNNLINPTFDWPLSERELRIHLEKNYVNPYEETHHYEIISKEEQEEKFGKVLLNPGTIVDQTFFDAEPRFITDTKPEENEVSSYIIINSNYHIIDGVTWIQQNGIWKRKISNGIPFYNQSSGTTVEISGTDIAKRVSVFEYETEENEKRRNIYVLKPKFITALIDDFRKNSKYKKSSQFLDDKLKASG